MTRMTVGQKAVVSHVKQAHLTYYTLQLQVLPHKEEKTCIRSGVLKAIPPTYP